MTSHYATGQPRVHMRLLSRLIPIHKELTAHRFPTLDKLAALLERSRRTVQRDLQRMRDEWNAPVYYDYERRGWGYRQLGWAPPPVTISEGDLLAFFVAEHALKMTGHEPEAILLRGSLARLATYLPEHVVINLTTLGEAMTFRQAPHVTVGPETLNALARAAGERRTVAFDYHSQHRNEMTHRSADPLLLHNFAGDWYLIAFDHKRQEERVFHAGRIMNLRETPDYFDPPPDWNRDTYLRRSFYMILGGRATTVSIVFDSYQARWMRERQAFHPEEQREELPGGELRLSFQIGSNGLAAVARFCLTYAGHCRVERPAALRRMIREQLVLALKQYEEE